MANKDERFFAAASHYATALAQEQVGGQAGIVGGFGYVNGRQHKSYDVPVAAAVYGARFAANLLRGPRPTPQDHYQEISWYVEDPTKVGIEDLYIFSDEQVIGDDKRRYFILTGGVARHYSNEAALAAFLNAEGRSYQRVLGATGWIAAANFEPVTEYVHETGAMPKGFGAHSRALGKAALAGYEQGGKVIESCVGPEDAIRRLHEEVAERLSTTLHNMFTTISQEYGIQPIAEWALANLGYTVE